MVQLSQAYLEWKQETEQQGIKQGERSLILRLLNHKLGELSEETRSQIETLSRPQLEALGEALLDFQAIADLDNWLQVNQ